MNHKEPFKHRALREIAIFKNGKKRPEREANGNFPIYGSNGIIGYSDQSNSGQDTIIIGRVGSYCGSLYFSEKECWVTDNAIVGRAKDGTDPKFLFYLLKHLDLNNQRGGSGQPLLNQEILYSIEAGIPPSGDQIVIGSILFALDRKIQLNQQMNKTLESIGQAVFERWFVDFEFPNEEGKPYKSSGGRMIESEGGKIPIGWKVDRLGNHAIIKGRIGWKGLQVSEYVKEGPRIVGGTQLVNGCVNWDECPHVTLKRYYESPEIMLKPNDILMTKDGTIGKMAYVDELKEPATVASGIFVIRANSFAVNQMYLLSFFKSDNFNNLVETRIEGSVVPHLYQRDIEDFLIIVPTRQISLEFEQTFAVFRQRIATNSKSSLILGKLRDLLLRRLMSGKVRVSVAGETMRAK